MKARSMQWLGLLVVLLAGFLMVAPSAFAASDGGYSATCKDGTSWTGTGKRGACRGHKGVKSWTSEAASSAAAEPAAKTKHERESRSSKKSEETTSAAATTNETASASAGGAVSATCKDGTSWSGKSKRGACRGHKGVKGWGDAAAAPAPVPTDHAPAAAPMPVSHRTSTRTASAGGSMGTPAPGGGAGKVWVNSGSKTYHCQGTRWYGTTKHGEYMSETQAKAQGYHADHGKACSG